MVDPWRLFAENGHSGHSIRAAVENPPPTNPSADPGVAQNLDEVVRHAVDMVYNALDITGHALGKAVDVASDKAFESAATVGANIATPQTANAIGQSSFSWNGYIQALGIMSLILAALWFGVWFLRRYGKFNFLPRPGALPKNALVMEAQMPLGPRKGLMVVRFLNRRLLLGVTEHQISYLTEEVTGDERPAKDFQGIMEEVRNTRGHSDTGGNSS